MTPMTIYDNTLDNSANIRKTKACGNSRLRGKMLRLREINGIFLTLQLIFITIHFTCLKIFSAFLYEDENKK